MWVTSIFKNIYFLLEIVLYIQHIELHVMGRFENSLWPLDISVTFSLVYKFAGTIFRLYSRRKRQLGIPKHRWAVLKLTLQKLDEGVG